MKKMTGITMLEECRFKNRRYPIKMGRNRLVLPVLCLSCFLLAEHVQGIAALAEPVTHEAKSRWEGVDKTVIEKVAEEAGRPPQGSLLPIDQGDLPLLMFLLAGAVGGFVAGYAFRSVFPPRSIAIAATGVGESGKLS